MTIMITVAKHGETNVLINRLFWDDRFQNEMYSMVWDLFPHDCQDDETDTMHISIYIHDGNDRVFDTQVNFKYSMWKCAKSIAENINSLIKKIHEQSDNKSDK